LLAIAVAADARSQMAKARPIEWGNNVCRSITLAAPVGTYAITAKTSVLNNSAAAGNNTLTFTKITALRVQDPSHPHNVQLP